MMDYTRGIINGSIAVFLAIATPTIFLVSMDILQIKIGSPSLFDENYESRHTQRELVIALKESLPVYAKTIVTDHKLSDKQRESLVALYLPIITEFVKSGDTELIEKAKIARMLIINNTITALKAE